jgi:hypothetical protein
MYNTVFDAHNVCKQNQNFACSSQPTEDCKMPLQTTAQTHPRNVLLRHVNAPAVYTGEGITLLNAWKIMLTTDTPMFIVFLNTMHVMRNIIHCTSGDCKRLCVI